MSSILLTGGSGMLGGELLKLRDFLTPTHAELDITQSEQVKDYLHRHNPSLIVNCAGYIGSSEEDNNEIARCYEVNVKGVKNLTNYATCPIVHISTEGVVEPYNSYTMTKFMAERVVQKHTRYTIVRTNFWPRPFPFPRACHDLLTIGDYVDVIANRINRLIDLPCENEIVYVGTGLKTVFDVAKVTVPDIEPVACANFGLPMRKGLLNI